MAARRLTRGELISAASALVLVVTLFVAAWYGVVAAPGPRRPNAGITITQTGWDGLTAIRWLVLVTALVALGTPLLSGTGLNRQAVASVRLILLVLACVTAVALVIRVLIELPSPQRVVDQKLGAMVGLFAGLGIVYGATATIREQRARLLGGR